MQKERHPRDLPTAGQLHLCNRQLYPFFVKLTLGAHPSKPVQASLSYDHTTKKRWRLVQRKARESAELSVFIDSNCRVRLTFQSFQYMTTLMGKNRRRRTGAYRSYLSRDISLIPHPQAASYTRSISDYLIHVSSNAYRFLDIWHSVDEVKPLGWCARAHAALCARKHRPIFDKIVGEL